MSKDFEVWWHREGSGMPPLPGEDAEIHVKRISEIAWSNGAFKARDGFDELRKLADELETCAKQLGWTSSDDVKWIKAAEAAVKKYNAYKASH